MLWFLIIILALALVYILSEHAMQVRKRNQQLEQIEKRLAEKRAEPTGHEDEPPGDSG